MHRKHALFTVLLPCAAVAFALLLTFVYPGTNGLDFDLDGSARAQAARNREPYDLTQLRVLNRTILEVKDNYVDPSRVDPRRMLLSGLNAIQKSVAPVMVDYEEGQPTFTVTVENQRQQFRLDDVNSPWTLASRIREVFAFLQRHLDPEVVELREVEYAAVNGMLQTVDPHLHRRRSLAEIYTIPTEVVHAAPLLTAWIRAQVAKPLVVGPDAESEQWVREVAEAVPCPYVVLDKVRHGDRNVVVSVVPEIRRWADRTPVLVDDIISSAATMSTTVRQWIEAGLTAPVCLGVHGVFAAHAYETLQAAGPARIVTTNSIPHASNDIDISPALVEPVRRMLGRANESRTQRTVSAES